MVAEVTLRTGAMGNGATPMRNFAPDRISLSAHEPSSAMAMRPSAKAADGAMLLTRSLLAITPSSQVRARSHSRAASAWGSPSRHFESSAGSMMWPPQPLMWTW